MLLGWTDRRQRGTIVFFCLLIHRTCHNLGKQIFISKHKTPKTYIQRLPRFTAACSLLLAAMVASTNTFTPNTPRSQNIRNVPYFIDVVEDSSVTDEDISSPRKIIPPNLSLPPRMKSPKSSPTSPERHGSPRKCF
jgi:hypothetical protein